MARTHSRSCSPDPSAKRIKTTHPTSTSEIELSDSFATDVLDASNVATLHKSYLESEPFRYALIRQLFQDDLLKKVKDECLGELSFTEKETDIYKVNQTGDLASLNYLDSSQLSLLPNLLKLRDALYSPKFRAFLRSVTGCGPLSGIKQDMSVNSYTKGCHLLNHDDVIGTRRVSYILYMPLPHYQLWQKDWGGALELYPTKPGPDGVPEPECVQPGRSFHSVEEVVVGSGGEDGRERLSISGWFHDAQEGEEGYEPVEEAEIKSSREQLASTQTDFKSYSSSEQPPLPDVELSEEQALSSRFVEESSLELHSFLVSSLAEALEPRLKGLDAQDGLGPERNGKIPPHCSGVDASNPDIVSADDMPQLAMNAPNPSSTPLLSDALSATGIVPALPDPHINGVIARSFPPSPSARAVSITPISAHPNPSEILRKLQDELFPSQAFRAWLAILSRLLPLRHFVEARRFRPGLDYTLATSEENEARLDVVLGLTPDVKDQDAKDGIPLVPRGWSAAEWGGWECYMAPHNEEDDPAVYRAGTYKKSDVLQNAAKKETNGKTNGHAVNGTNGTNGTSNGHAVTNGNGKHSSPAISPHPSADGEGEDEDEDMNPDDDEEDSTLLTVQPGFNRLLLVLRDERVMRFVKYVSGAAEGSRWDVCAEYEVGMMQEEGEE
ncbi:hypothetical protein BT96DRAFT_1016009 [Gymnopus androsaceus JB14]|uniref:Fe2OG dioxygenase domain-containing protein n=1 Tax=Gymnopus androsaceus JB14 TaxID=1447944 RepID=A0A6A4I2V5_9AGAR|nr:hypothetical protein BT96DRAFT_1016009 [Gymnopus androsaceus JB14]